MSLRDDWENIPKSMTETKQWLCFIFQDRGTGRLGKPPVSPKTKKIVDKTDETQWATFSRAYGAYEAGSNVEGIGFIFDNGFIAIDLDDCFEENGTLTAVAQDVLDHFSGAYVEYSPSGNGLHIFVKGKKPNNRTKDSKLGIEVYDNKNFVTVTGDVIDDSGNECVDMQEQLEWLFETYLPEQNVKGVDYTSITPEHGDKTPQEWLATGVERDEKLSILYNDTDHSGDESSEDMSLISKLAYWLNRDYDAIKDAFTSSPWFESKDTRHKMKCLERKDYLDNSITNAINRTVETAQERDDKFKNRVKVKLRAASDAQGGDVQSLVDDRFLADLTDAGTAQLMADVYGDILCYTVEFGWCWYNGKVWELNNKTAAMRCAVDITDIILEEAQNWVNQTYAQLDTDMIDPDSKEGKQVLAAPMRLMRYVTTARKAATLKSIMEIATTKMVKPRSAFDSNEWILNTPLCLIDLRTGERIAHNPSYMCTAITSVTPDDRKTDLWEKTLHDTYCGDEDLIRYVQLHMGSALIGKVFQENLLIANGSGANGKSTFFGAIQFVLGDYATSVDPELLLSSRPAEQQVGMAMLHGKRLAVAQETDEGKALCGAMLKRLVSTDVMVAKHLYRDPFNFTPTHTLVLSTNHLPRIKSNDTGTWRRIDVLPFNATIAPEKTITDYMGMLVKECGSEILQWCIDGARAFYENGCIIKKKPEAVETARVEYRENEDWLMQFITECVDESQEAQGKILAHSDLYAVYAAWCARTGMYKRSSIMLSKALRLQGWSGGNKVWVNELQKVAMIWNDKALLQGVLNRSNVIKIRETA